VATGRLTIADPQGDLFGFGEDARPWRGDGKQDKTIGRKPWGGAQPAARYFERNSAAPDESKVSMGNNQACREINLLPDQQDLSFPDDAIGLKRPPLYSPRSANCWPKTVIWVSFVAEHHFPSPFGPPVPA